MGRRLLPAAVLVLGLALHPRRLHSQVPIAVVEARETGSEAYVRALKAALLGSGSFRYVESETQRHVSVAVLTGTTLTCGATQYRSVALIISVRPSRPTDGEYVVSAMYEMGNEESSAQGQLEHIHRSALLLGITGTSR